MPAKSRYTLIVENLDSYTRSRDIKEECRYFGDVRAVERDVRSRCALVEFDRSSAAERAYDKLHGISMHGKKWSVDWATPKDFDFFGWKWTEGGVDESPLR
ncbi:SRS9 [Auxenochlorella protothecoides x Auxenochlorella symbiontica]